MKSGISQNYWVTEEVGVPLMRKRSVDQPWI